MNALPSIPERRQEDRHPATALLPAAFRVAARSAVLSGILIDISQRGLCFASRTELSLGTELRILTLKGPLSFKVVWRRAPQGTSVRSQWEFGLLCTDTSIDLRFSLSHYYGSV